MSKVTIPDTYIADELHFEDCKFASNTLTLNATKNTYIAGQHSSIEKVEIKSTDANFHIFNLTDLTEVVFPKGLTNIQSYAFDTCSQLKSIELPSSLKKISSHAFYDCGMQSVKLPEGFEELEAYAFEDCQAMSYVVIPKSLTKIDKDAFSGCTALYRIYYTGTEEEWKQIKVLSSGNETDTDINTLFSNCRISFNYKTGWQQEYDQWVYYSESGIKV
ncbi:MAG: leucine-rich repeat domain-containing protein [Saccharofermentans sp.]|nr:leucine-rich repeat domain-containing protein [Saccharofermentans sp.]